MIVGAVGVVLSLILWAPRGEFGGGRRERTVITRTRYRGRDVI
jgi:hypothetical protein